MLIACRGNRGLWSVYSESTEERLIATDGEMKKFLFSAIEELVPESLGDITRKRRNRVELGLESSEDAQLIAGEIQCAPCEW